MVERQTPAKGAQTNAALPLPSMRVTSVHGAAIAQPVTGAQMRNFHIDKALVRSRILECNDSWLLAKLCLDFPSHTSMLRDKRQL